ncbi:MAG: PDR/VanB family oxidoreductase [Mycolicibacterium neoaurum]|uniref:PDR/VanB family oxidoreductase n=1 Tax=Mycolicibacterium neoaurum TaxID=1795 RepID=UPI002FF8487A
MRTLKLVVTGIDDSIEGVRTLTLSDPDGVPLPSFAPGSHIVLECGTVANAYSLTGDGTAPDSYEISVLRCASGSGGSMWLHERVVLGDTLIAGPPRSAFAPVLRARKHLMIAAGIGITPMVSHLRSSRVWGRRTELLYVHRPGRGVFVDTVTRLADDVSIHTGRTGFDSTLRTTLTGQPFGTHLYVCGPAAFIADVTATAVELGWPDSRIHLEHFGSAALDPGEPFTMRIASTGEQFTVEAGVSLLEVLEQRGFDVPNLCRKGVCGECRIPVAGGAITHRDLFLGDEDRQAGDTLMACVSRGDGGTLEVAL